MSDNDIYALFTTDVKADAKDNAKQARLDRPKVARKEELDKPAQDLLVNVANPLRIAWWF